MMFLIIKLQLCTGLNVQYCAMQFLADFGANVLVDFRADFFFSLLVYFES